MRLVHAWMSGLWVTLRFLPVDTPDSGGFHDVSIWKFSLSDTCWRQLRLQIGRQASMPASALKKENA